MHYYRCLKSNQWCRFGQWLANEAPGDDFYLCEVEEAGKNRVKVRIRTGLTLPFDKLAHFVTPLGFQVPISALREPLPTQVETLKEIQEFQSEVEDIYEEEKLKRDKAANPTHTGKTE